MRGLREGSLRTDGQRERGGWRVRRSCRGWRERERGVEGEKCLKGWRWMKRKNQREGFDSWIQGMDGLRSRRDGLLMECSELRW